jgi:hypothetical protein
VFLSSADFYALRCSFLHEGRDDITDQSAQEVLKRFQFVVPSHGFVTHCNQLGRMIQLQVSAFCRQICDGASEFAKSASANPAALARLEQLLLIRDTRGVPKA